MNEEWCNRGMRYRDIQLMLGNEKKCYLSMPEHEMRMGLQLFGHYIRQRNVLPPQSCAAALSLTQKKPIVLEQIFHLKNRWANTFRISKMTDF